jgi:hypothetical protein
LHKIGEPSSTGAKLSRLLEQAELKSAHATTLNAIRKFQEAV